jgi:hypothetical protein
MLLTKIAAGVVLALSTMNPSFEVQFEDGVLNDIGTTYRYIASDSYATTSCTVVVDSQNLTEIGLRLDSAGISFPHDTFKTFILLHELAHCYDMDREPQGVDPVQWREYLADEFAATELFAQGAINKSDFQRFIRLRRTYTRSIPHVPMAKSIHLIDSEGFADTTVDRFNAARTFRNKHLRPDS